ncbi:M15 family metallopeptidase [Nocardioides sp. URHA0020]|uniref:M15 family metallopeptidase n=1 Tax=Nocardioides sp. URHA0020 TaxID=1380392 RepID=UPI000567FF7A|nr:M15 family metallopeptidase [Nocardioides sp. URHA0020]
MRTTAALSIPIILLATACSSSGHPAPAPGAVGSTPAAMRVETSAQPRPAFDRTRHSTSDPRSIWVVVNKKHPIDAGYRPQIDLVRGYQVAAPAAAALTRLLDDSDVLGLGFKIASAYRSYGYQADVYSGVVESSGRPAADRVSARPGHSEHQTGLAVDLVAPDDPACDFDACFAGTPGGRWLAREAWRYGFVVRYRPGSATVTGYSPEPWHLRYVGRALATELRRTRTDTLEVFFDITGGDYP